MKLSKKTVCIVLVFVLLVGCAWGFVWFHENYVLMGGVQSRSATELDLSGNTKIEVEKLLELTSLEKLDLRNTNIGQEEFERIKAAKPDCEILWSVPFQGGYQDSNREMLTIDVIEESDIAQLVYFPNLKTVNADGCDNLPMIGMLMETYPHLAVSYHVPVGDAKYPHDATALELTNLDVSELRTALMYLPDVKRIEIQGVLPEAELLLDLAKDYPTIEFYWESQLFGAEVNVNTKEVTLADVPTEYVSNLIAELRYVPCIEKVNLEGMLADASALKELTAAYPQVEFYWQIELFGVPADVHTTELDLSNIPMESVDTVENALPYLPSLQKVIMSHCGISNEDMDALWKRHPEVRFVWSVRVGTLYVRTDETAFTPAKYNKLLTGNEGYNLRYCVDMECLDLGHASIPDCEFVAFMPNLKYLLLADTDITDITPIANHDKLVHMELFACRGIKDFTPLLTLKNLEDLNVCFTSVNIEVLQQMTWLKNLWWSNGKNNPAIPMRRQILSEALPNTHLELDTVSATGHGWRQLPHYYEQRDLFGMKYMFD